MDNFYTSIDALSRLNYLYLSGVKEQIEKIKFANIINIAANEEIIPELLQSKCNSKNIFNTVNKILNNHELKEKQISSFQIIIEKFKTEKSSEIASSILNYHL